MVKESSFILAHKFYNFTYNLLYTQLIGIFTDTVMKLFSFACSRYKNEIIQTFRH